MTPTDKSIEPMRYTAFGRRTGLRVSEYALGTASLGASGSGRNEEARRVFERFAEAGGTFLDTADQYRSGDSERLVGDLVAGDRDRFVVATKYGNEHVPTSGISSTGNGRKNLVRSVEASLRRLRTDYVDLYWAHVSDEITPVEEILRGFDDLVRAGKILHCGLSNFPAWRVSRGALLADLRGWAPLAGIQIEHSLAERSAERELLPMAESLGLGVAMWSPLARGLLTDNGQGHPVAEEVRAVAGEIGASPAQVALAWLRRGAARSATSLIPILGPVTRAELDDCLGALRIDLPEPLFDRLSQVSAVPPGVPHETTGAVRDAVLGGDAGRMARPAVPVP